MITSCLEIHASRFRGSASKTRCVVSLFVFVCRQIYASYHHRIKERTRAFEMHTETHLSLPSSFASLLVPRGNFTCILISIKSLQVSPFMTNNACMKANIDISVVSLHSNEINLKGMSINREV